MDFKKIIEEMTLEEKAGLLSGRDFWKTRNIDRLGIDSFMMCDGPNGLRKQEGEGDHLGINESIKTVCYPTSSAIGASFDTELAEEIGKTLGEECRRERVSMSLGPGLNMKRSPLGGRNFEYYSEDPYLAGKMATAYVNGLQSRHVLACPKHFAGNNQESHRMSGNSTIDERTLHEIYLSAFEMVVKNAHPHAMMCAYNQVNGTFMSENRELLTDVLRDKWGFDGFVVTDWGAAKDPVKGVKAGLDLVMPGGTDQYRDQLITAVKNGDLEESVIDAAAERLLRNLYWNKEQDLSQISSGSSQSVPVSDDRTRQRDYQIALKAALSSAVLLKNEDNILPLRDHPADEAGGAILFVGEFAKEPRYQGSGSSHINSAFVSNALDEAAKAGHPAAYAKGYDTRDSSKDAELLAEAVAAAGKAEKVVIFAGLPNAYESEGFDRESLDMPDNQNNLIEAIANVNPNVIVVLHNGSAITMPWIGRVKAVLEMYLAGDGCGEAEIRLLYGAANPSGKLAETFPLRLQDTPAYLNFPGDEGNPVYHEGIFIGYRYYDKKEMPVLFPFGHGLSYTHFTYSNLKLSQDSIRDTDAVTVSVDVTNDGDRSGREVVQLYVTDKESTRIRPVRELKGFEKISLDPGETKTVSFVLDERAFAYYEVKLHDFFVESGTFTISVGSSSRDIRLKADLYVEGTKEIPVTFTLSSTIGQILNTKKGKAILAPMLAQMAGEKNQQEQVQHLGEGSDKMMQVMMMEMPLAGLISMAGVPKEKMIQLLSVLNA